MPLHEPMMNEGPPEHEKWLAKGGVRPETDDDEPDEAQAAGETDDDEEELPSSELLMSVARAADQLSKQSDLANRRSAMTRSWRAFNSRHPEGSRFLHENYSARSKLFIPKTHMAVTKFMVSTAATLFSTNDVVSISAEREADPRQKASADILKADLNIRLDRTNAKSGVPWFFICMAACQEAQVAGITVSKQYWEFEQVEETFHVDDPKGNVFDMQGRRVSAFKKKRVVADKPLIEPHAAENVVVDMAAPFYNVIQGGAFLLVRIPMHIGDVRTMMKPGRGHMGGGAWFKIPDSVITASARDYTNAAVRVARDKGGDRYSTNNQAKINDLQIVWVHENFVRWGGRDYQFWTLGNDRLLSEPVETIEAYPACHGERPYVMGIGAIEAHNAIPTSPVESYRPLQEETNFGRNLIMDSVHQSIAPLAKVVRGKKVDLRQLRKRGPDATVLVTDKDDVTFEIPPSNAQLGFEMMDRVANELDEMAGAWSNSSIQQNHNLNETLGGMKMLSGAASGKTEYDVRIFIETYVEPVIRQVVWNIQYYETDERLVAIAGDKAKLFQKYGDDIDPLDDTLLEEEVTVRVNAGLGSADPVQRLQKLLTGLKALQELAATGAFNGQVFPIASELFGEVMGLSGYPEAERFFKFVDPETAQKSLPPSKDALEAKKLENEIKGDEEDRAMERDKFEHEKATGSKDFGLRAAGQNKTLIDEATGEAKEVMDPQEAREPLPVEKMLGDTVGQLLQLMGALVQSQQQQTQQITSIVQQGQQTLQAIAELTAYQRAPKDVVRDEKGTVIGVQVRGFNHQPVARAGAQIAAA